MSAAGAAGPAGHGQPSGPSAGGLRTDQAPPLSIPASFFLVAPVAMIASGVLLASSDVVLVSRLMPFAMAATHLGTLGFLGALMLGALYQMIPVVAGVPVPWVRLAHVVHALFVAGLGMLVAGLALGTPTLLVVASIMRCSRRCCCSSDRWRWRWCERPRPTRPCGGCGSRSPA